MIYTFKEKNVLSNKTDWRNLSKNVRAEKNTKKLIYEI